jgi:hypothetical protein
LITDIARCSVDFESVKDMSDFIEKWILKYGHARQNTQPNRWGSNIQNLSMQMREFSRFLGEHIRKAFRIQSGDDEINPQFTERMETSAGSENDKHLFEICRVRNRFDPALIDVPGGYRDVAFKLKIGFVRYVIKCIFFSIPFSEILVSIF